MERLERITCSFFGGHGDFFYVFLLCCLLNRKLCSYDIGIYSILLLYVLYVSLLKKSIKPTPLPLTPSFLNAFNLSTLSDTCYKIPLNLLTPSFLNAFNLSTLSDTASSFRAFHISTSRGSIVNFGNEYFKCGLR